MQFQPGKTPLIHIFRETEFSPFARVDSIFEELKPARMNFVTLTEIESRPAKQLVIYPTRKGTYIAVTGKHIPLKTSQDAMNDVHFYKPDDLYRVFGEGIIEWAHSFVEKLPGGLEIEHNHFLGPFDKENAMIFVQAIVAKNYAAELSSLGRRMFDSLSNAPYPRSS